jgi:glycosyltransferase involved in cell wall biosynthesis
MNLCFICDEYPPVSHGGIGTVTKSIAEELVRQNHNVFIVGILPKSYIGQKYEEVNGVKLWRIDHGILLPFLSRNTLLYKLLNKIFKVDFFNINSAWKKQNSLIEHLVSEHNIDVIEFPDYRFAFEHLTLKNNVWPNIDIFKTVKFHGSINYFNLEANLKIDQKVLNYETSLYEYADQLVSVSDYTRRKMMVYYDLKKDIKIIHNGLEIINKHKVEKDNIVIFSGSLVPKKGIVPLLKAWNIVCKYNDSAILKLYGKGIKHRYTKHIDPKNMNRVKFLGHINKEDLLNEYSTAKVAVFPSFAEAFALAPMEAMMTGCATIYSTATSGRELQVNDRALLLINPHEERQIAEKILEVLNNDDLRLKLELEGRKLIENTFNIKRTVQKHLDLYNSI